MIKNNTLWWIGSAIVIGLVIFLFFRKSGNKNAPILIHPKSGRFEVNIKTPGEVVAKNSQMIHAPSEIRRMNLANTKILDLVKEGTVVDSGAYIGQLDRTEVLGKILESELNVQKFLSEVEREKLDCTLTLAQAREDLVNLKYTLEEKKLEKDQSAYEPPAKQRQAEIDFEKATYCNKTMV